MKIKLAAKFEKNLMDGYLALVRTHGRTDATGNNSPSPINRGTKNLKWEGTRIDCYVETPKGDECGNQNFPKPQGEPTHTMGSSYYFHPTPAV